MNNRIGLVTILIIISSSPVLIRGTMYSLARRHIDFNGIVTDFGEAFMETVTGRDYDFSDGSPKQNGGL
ncbi:MAG: hypothetical protein F6K30_16265 [Cyanothece sp. SIO2G6]|nr:hypothetical protein [Cyanothece sp. SIO2G6]